MTDLRLARDIASALVGLSVEAGCLTRVLSELRTLNDAFSRNPSFMSDLRHPGVAKRTRLAALSDALGADVHPYLKNAMLVLLERDALDDLAAFTEAVRRAAAERGSASADVRSAVPLTEDERESLLRVLSKKFDATMTLDETRDPTLLGGFVVTVGDWRFDGSVKGRIDRLTHELYV